MGAARSGATGGGRHYAAPPNLDPSEERGGCWGAVAGASCWRLGLAATARWFACAGGPGAVTHGGRPWPGRQSADHRPATPGRAVLRCGSGRISPSDADPPADPLHAGLGIGAVLAGCSALNYALFPSLFSDWIYLGDMFRLIAYLVFLTAAFREIGSYWQTQNQLAVLEERQRLARDLHDGLCPRAGLHRAPRDAATRHQRSRPIGSRRRRGAHWPSLATRSMRCRRAPTPWTMRSPTPPRVSAGRTHIVLDLDLDPAATAGRSATRSADPDRR